MNYLVTNSIDDESVNHATLLQRVFDEFPPEIAQLSVQYDWAVARGYLLKGVRAIMWDRPEDGHKHFEQAIKLGAQIDQSFIQQLTYHLLDYEAAFGEIAARRIIDSWEPHIENLGCRASVRHLYGSYAINRAFQSYLSHFGESQRIAGDILEKLAHAPTKAS